MTRCKPCHSLYNKKNKDKYRKSHPKPTSKQVTKKQFVARVWQSIKNGRGGYYATKGIRTILTKEEFDLFSEDKTFELLFDSWDKEGRPFYLTPSIDRINPDGHYEVDNIRWLTVSQNVSAKRINKKSQEKPVNMYSKDGAFIRRFDSASQAVRFFNRNNCVNISRCCRGLIPSAYGHVWKYVDKPKKTIEN